jgi:hypothetical protein
MNACRGSLRFLALAFLVWVTSAVPCAAVEPVKIKLATRQQNRYPMVSDWP